MYKHQELTGEIIKAAQNVHNALGYGFLKATNIDIGLLLNFGKSLKVKRKIFETARQR